MTWLGKPVAKAIKLVMYFRGVALERGLKGQEGCLHLETFKIKPTFAGLYKLPSQALNDISIPICMPQKYVYLHYVNTVAEVGLLCK